MNLKPLILQSETTVQDEFVKQGHNNTGRAVNSIQGNPTPNGFNIEGNDYINILNEGVSAGNIPYSGNGGGGTSKYIQGLIEYVLQRGIATGRAEATRVAFAIANKQRKEGMPTNASRRFSQTGKRTGFLDVAADKISNDVEEYLQDEAEKEINRFWK